MTGKLLKCPCCKHELGEYTQLIDKYEYIFKADCSNERCGYKQYIYKDMELEKSLNTMQFMNALKIPDREVETDE